MRATIVMLALALAACGQASAPPVATDEPTTETAAPAAPAMTGQFIAMSTTAMSITGSVDVETDTMNFSRGFTLEGGRIDAMLEADTDYSAGGGTISDSSGVQNIESVELRRIDRLVTVPDAPAPDLCGGKPPSHVILAANVDTLSVLIFSGADAPGPNAHETHLCGIFNYSAG